MHGRRARNIQPGICLHSTPNRVSSPLRMGPRVQPRPRLASTRLDSTCTPLRPSVRSLRDYLSSRVARATLTFGRPAGQGPVPGPSGVERLLLCAIMYRPAVLPRCLTCAVLRLDRSQACVPPTRHTTSSPSWSTDRTLPPEPSSSARPRPAAATPPNIVSWPRTRCDATMQQRTPSHRSS